ncbi:hypothetical protein V2J09_006303, partial [Rumex salicifolius]
RALNPASTFCSTSKISFKYRRLSLKKDQTSINFLPIYRLLLPALRSTSHLAVKPLAFDCCRLSLNLVRPPKTFDIVSVTANSVLIYSTNASLELDHSSLFKQLPLDEYLAVEDAESGRKVGEYFRRSPHSFLIDQKRLVEPMLLRDEVNLPCRTALLYRVLF